MSPQQTSSVFRMATSQVGHPPLDRTNHSPPKATSLPPVPAQAGASRWPSDLPRLPNPPVSPALPQSPRSHSPTRTPLTQNMLPRRKQSLRNPVAATVHQSRIRPPSIDDTPPRSLRRTPSPDAARFSVSHESTSRPNIRTNNVEPTSPGGRDSASTVTPGSASSLFSLSQFPQPPTQIPSSPVKGVFPPRSPRPNGSMAAAQQQSRQPRVPSPSQRQHSTRPPIPKISFPANADSESENEFPVIVISGSSGAPAAPKIAINGMNAEGPQVPSISIGAVDDTPQISVSGPSSRSTAALPPPPAIVGKGGLVCGGCGGPIIGRIVSAMGARWHPGCFRCCICDELLENLSSYEHKGRPFCHFDYHEVSYSVVQ